MKPGLRLVLRAAGITMIGIGILAIIARSF
jgi:hypothetical protein